ncbi:SPOR domain-containing protein [Paracoccus tibetensis]|uniref:Sporulation related domain-containing protein n=1 Tax=Paracoccus tibetensis TaxID=336292 RepID=A0A1G5H9T0_9RHOB|nr:SPOR domain-containing protein [Paracoccus tibetensis]SCY60652.1 Sporulation related domain-containing protein [Paracoccus tibetensis]
MTRLWQLLFLCAAGPALAAPVPPPPADFAGAQYIDGQGCVFTRTGDGWSPRPDPAGGQLCGFPPSLDVRRLDPDTVDVLPPLNPPPPADPAAILAERLAEELRRADIDGQTLAPPDLPKGRPDPMLTELSTMVEASGAVTSSLATLTGAPSDICLRMGYRMEPLPDGQRDPTGLCPGLRPPTPEPRHSVGAAQRVAASDPVSPATPAAAEATSQPARPARARPAAAPAPARPAAVRPAAPAPAREAAQQDVEMIPASARFVQIGSFTEAAAADAAIRALTAQGLPAARGKSSAGIAVMAGPFADRRSLIAALSRLRAGGWPGATAR